MIASSIVCIYIYIYLLQKKNRKRREKMAKMRNTSSHLCCHTSQFDEQSIKEFLNIRYCFIFLFIII